MTPAPEREAVPALEGLFESRPLIELSDDV